MDDEREEKLIYQSVVSLFKLLSKFTMGIPVNNVYFSYTWRMFRIYVLKPEVLAISLLVLFIILYIQTIDVYSKSVLRKLGLSFEERARLRRSQLTFGIDINSSSWEHKVGNVAAFAVQGRRPHMEDRFVIKDNINNTGLSMFAVFDGHGGTVMSIFLLIIFNSCGIFDVRSRMNVYFYSLTKIAYHVNIFYYC